MDFAADVTADRGHDVAVGPRPCPGGDGQRGLGLVEEELARFFADAKLRAASIGPPYLRLWEALERAADGGGRARPRLVLLAYHHLGGGDERAAALLAASYELLHTALLVHDDVIDRDLVRRGVPNVSGRYRGRALRAGADPAAADHAGASAGLLAGDLALAGAYRLLRRIEATRDVEDRLHDILDDALFSSVGGEVYDVELSHASATPSVEDLAKTAHRKTSVYSFEAPLRAGVVLAGAPARTTDALQRFGRDAGIAYQLVDDVLGVFGDPASTGKAGCSDLREGKRTVLLAYAASRPEWAGVAHLVGSPGLGPADAARIRRLLTECGARDYAVDLAAGHAERALAALESDCVPAPLRDRLRDLLLAVVSRVRPR
ncbi:polyprenyl synthetase family protein [Zhihengliuella sp.]|uniref:polyprenyl synthetase family protein n=1 Tax=Zhihengliuella sp. TaxID=1954483 RepID=UPI00281126B0|nr:polyprenyl synthetase family protein [Zhihengliuella sp.]